MAAVAEGGGWHATERRPISDGRKGYTLFQRGDVIVAKITPCFENGKVALLSALESHFGDVAPNFYPAVSSFWRLDLPSRACGDESRDIARTLLSHPLYTVRERVGKAQLLDTLGGYDVGLHWAPMAEQDYDYNYFQSTASNKIGEYVAAGLAVAYAGNPGLSFLPREISLVFDRPTPRPVPTSWRRRCLIGRALSGCGRRRFAIIRRN
jgi:hypothetical protein